MSVSKPFDAATKHLFEADPMAWLHFLKLQGDAADGIAVVGLEVHIAADREDNERSAGNERIKYVSNDLE